MKLDLHLHSEFSWDSNVKISEYIQKAEEQEFGAISICDHNSTESHAIIDKLQDQTEVLLIPGQEISTNGGHLLVYGWIDTIERDLSMEETVRVAQEKRGYCIAAHPFDPFRGGSFSKVFQTGIDGIEILNASAWLGIFNRWAQKGRTKINKNNGVSLAGVANSDSHRIEEFGAAYTIIQEVSSFDEIFSGISNARIAGSRIGMRKKAIRFFRRKFIDP